MGTQLQLSLMPAVPNALSLNGTVREILLTHDWLSPYEIQRLVEAKTGVWHSDAAITARLRDLRKPAFGGHGPGTTVIKRKREGSHSYEYRLEA